MSVRKEFDAAIAEAAQHYDHNVADPNGQKPGGVNPAAPAAKTRRPLNERRAQAEAEAAFAAVAAKVREEHGCAVIWTKPRAARKKTQAEYRFWKGPITFFIEFPEMLDLGPTALAKRFDRSEANFTVTKDTIRAPLSGPARKEARRLLQSRGFDLKLPHNFAIRDIQKAMKDHRDRATGVKQFKPSIEIVGDTVYCDRKSFKMQPTGSGKMRIKAGGGWLPVHALAAFLSGQQ